MLSFLPGLPKLSLKVPITVFVSVLLAKLHKFLVVYHPNIPKKHYFESTILLNVWFDSNIYSLSQQKYLCNSSKVLEVCFVFYPQKSPRKIFCMASVLLQLATKGPGLYLVTLSL